MTAGTSAYTGVNPWLLLFSVKHRSLRVHHTWLRLLVSWLLMAANWVSRVIVSIQSTCSWLLLNFVRDLLILCHST